MKKSTKIGLYILSGAVITGAQVAKRYCKVKAKNGKSKFYNTLNEVFDFIGNWMENIMAVSMVIGMFV